MKKIPKRIKEKCERMERLCLQALSLRFEVEKWCEKNGIDIYSKEWNEIVRDEIGGCDFVLLAEGIEEMLNLTE